MRKIIALLIAIVCAGTAFAAPQTDLMFRHYTMDDGLASNCIRDIAQDSDGFVWLATDGGVVRFDGFSFKSYSVDCPLEDIDDNNYVSALLIAGNDFYAGTDSHLYRYDKYTDRFEYVAFVNEAGKPQKLNIRDMVMDRDSNLWLAVLGTGAIKVKKQPDGSFLTETYSFPDARNFLSTLFVDSRNDVWAVSNVTTRGLYRLDKAKNAFVPFALKIDGREIDVPAMDMAEDEVGGLWIGNWSGTLLKFDPYSGDAQRFSLEDEYVSHIHSINPVGDGQLMIGSDNGLVKFETKSGAHSSYVRDELNPLSLSGQFVYPVMRDREGGLWVGTFYSGLNYAPPMLKNFESYKSSKHKPNSVSGYVISAFAEDGRGNIYIASDDGGLSRFSPGTGRFDKVPTNGTNNLHALAYDGEYMYIGSYGAGVYRLGLPAGRLEKISAPESKYREISSYAMLYDSKGRLWVASSDGLNLYDKANNSLSLVKPFSTQISDIAESPMGELWVSTQGEGLHVMDRSGQWRSHTVSKTPGSISHNHVAGTAFTPDGTAWVATARGLCRYDAETGTFAIATPELANIEFFSVIEDQGALWITSGQGLIKYEPNVGVQSFGVSDGLCSSQFMPGSIFKTSNGKIYVGTRSGFNAFYPYQIKPNAVLPNLAFTGLEINNREVCEGDSHLTSAIGQMHELQLVPGDNSLGITFAALSYVNPHKNKYAYRLRGFDKDWIESDGTNKAFYTNLPVGDYEFEVKASNNDNLWVTSPISMKIKVLPPWYWSWYMKAIYLLLLLGMIGGAIWVLNSVSEKRHAEELTRMKNRKDTELYESKLQFFTMVAHEIRTPVSLILGPIEKLMGQSSSMPHSVGMDLAVIERNSQRLLFLVNQLLDFKKSEETGLPVRFQKCKVCDLVASVVDRFRPTLEQKNIRLEVKCNVDHEFTAEVDPEAITKLVSNLMNNARKFTKDYIGISVDADEQKGQLTIVVSDNGCGIAPAEQKKIFRPFYQVAYEDNTMRGGTGLGLSIVQSVVEAHKGSVAVDSELGKGTAFTVKLPLVQDNVEEVEAVQQTSDSAHVESAPTQPSEQKNNARGR